LPKLFTITSDWGPQPWYSTGGTRAKKYLQAPDGKFYYFKRSQYKDATAAKPGKDYKYEFWSEVIAYEVGTLLGFEMLEYNIAIDGDIMGCISQSMIDSENEELIEGVKYLQAFSPDYDPVKKEHQVRYTIHLIEHALKAAKLGSRMEHIIELIVFDALIGNGDRHQENWAFITRQRLITSVIEEAERLAEFKKLKRWQRWLINIYKRLLKSGQEGLMKQGKPLPKTYYDIEKRPAPIYDSGSSLGRELLDNKVEALLSSDEALNKYIDKGPAEIRWDEKKVSHFDLVQQLLDSKYHNTAWKVIRRVSDKWDGPKIAGLIRSIDEGVPESHKQYKLPEARKSLIIKMITLRYQRLTALIHAGV
jgi:hypothetical protein